jgi:alkylation response protein AidB-like acyl-CoA dehydrogenase
MSNVYGLGEAGSGVVARVAEICRASVAPHAADVDSTGRFPREGMTALAEAGLYGLLVPTSVGGMGASPRTFCAVVEEIAQHCASAAMVFVMHGVATTMIASSALPNRDAVLGDIAAGRHLTTLAFSEKGSRSQFWMPVSKLVPDGIGWATDAAKSWVTSAGHADSYVSSAQAPHATSPTQSTLYLVRRRASGVRVAAGWNGLGLRGNDSAAVELDHVRVSPEDLLTGQGEGLGAMLNVVLPFFAIGTSAMANGLCRAAVTATAAHLSTAGWDGGGALRDLPNLRARIAEMSMRTEQSRALLGFTAGYLECPDAMTPLYVLQSRMAAITAAVDVTDLAMKACGGAAFSKQLGVERLFRDARAGWVMAPTTDHLQDFVGRALTGLPLM